MRKQLLSFFLLMGCGVGSQLHAQTTALGVPYSWRVKTLRATVPSVQMPSVDVAAQLAIDAINEANKVGQWRFGYEHPVHLGLQHTGQWTTLPNGDRIWQLEIHCPNALSINLVFEDFFMPEGASVQLYSPDRQQHIGAYTSRNNSPAAMLGTSLLRGDKMIVEYYEPAQQQGNGRLSIGTVVHGYKPLRGYSDQLKDLNDSGACNYDVGCPLGTGWEAEISSVALIIDGGGICTGAIVNNTTNDGTPYFLTANHCLGGEASWVFRFNWNSPTFICAANGNSSDPGAPYDEINGCVRRAASAGSDFGLLELNGTPDPAWDVMYAGWDRSGNQPAPVTAIHHPSGDVKKISRENDNLVSQTWSGAQVWQVTNWDLGVTEPGSSGSPLFDGNHRIVGQLYGGGSACAGTVTNGDDDNYGRFAISWDGGGAANNRLKDWLDPTNSGAITVDTYNPNTPTVANDAGVRTISDIPASLCNTTTITPTITVKNYGFDPLTSVDVYYNVDGGANVLYQWTGNVASLASASITLPTITVPTAGLHTFNAYTDLPNNSADPNAGNNAASFDFYITLNGQALAFDLQLDEYGDETTWEIADQQGTILASGGPYSNDFQNPALIQETFCLAPDCYTFTIYDDYGDGLAGWNQQGDFSITDPQGTVLVNMTAPNGNFGNSEVHNFCVTAPPLAPVAQISAGQSTACAGGTITFTDASLNTPTTWAWSFPGGTPASSTASSEVVSYATAGSYVVQLIATNAAGSDTTVQNITVAANTLALSGNVTNESTSGNDGAVNATVSGGAMPYTYVWSNGNNTADISGLMAGNYTVTVTDVNGCTASQTFTVTLISGLNAWTAQHQWNIYPNPTRNNATVDIRLEAAQSISLELCTVTGQVLQTFQLAGAEQHRLTLPLNEYSAGVYFLQLRINGVTSVKKIVKFDY